MTISPDRTRSLPKQARAPGAWWKSCSNKSSRDSLAWLLLRPQGLYNRGVNPAAWVQLPATYCLWPAAPLHAAHRQLHAISSLLPTAYCVPPPSSCLLLLPPLLPAALCLLSYPTHGWLPNVTGLPNVLQQQSVRPVRLTMERCAETAHFPQCVL